MNPHYVVKLLSSLEAVNIKHSETALKWLYSVSQAWFIALYSVHGGILFEVTWLYSR